VESAARQALTTFERYEAEFRVVHRDGSIRWLAGLGNVVRQDRKPVRLAGVNWDITARKQAESEREQLLESERAARTEAERASRLKDEFLSTVSHELRTPLNAILGWSQLLKGRDTAGDEDLAMGLAVIDRNARAQVQLIEDLLDMGRIISGKVRLELRELDLQEVIHIAVSSVAPSAEAKGVRLLKSLSSRSIIVRGDPDRLQQVVWNLVSNGIKFTPKGGEIRVTVQPEGDMAEFSVSDTGQGIKSEFLPYVFDRFRQADGSTTRKYGGLGLGLAIVKNLVELHGGNVRIASGGEGLGATVTVQIPLSSASMPAGGSGREAKAGFTEQTDDDACSHFNLSGLTVLIVDDAADARDILARMLEDCHVRVQQASSAEEAMSILSEERTDVLVSDIGMPEMDGYEFIRRVRAQTDGKSRNVPAVALTAFARSEDRTRALLAGFQMHLAKPVQPTELMAAIGSLAGKTRIS
jgi:signal transduction histidine kinase/CheY-like chemotaxis protein